MRVEHALRRSVGVVAIGVALGLLLGSCSGPQRLDVAIRAGDEAAYQNALAATGGQPLAAYFRWVSGATGQSVGDLRAADDAMSEANNPFRAGSDPIAVSRGAVMYKAHCVRCHGVNADGRGPDMPVYIAAMDQHTFGKRLAATLHRGTPRSWFGTISEGAIAEQTGPAGQTLTMPAYGPQMSRGQIWCLVTYLQSLDADASGDRG